MSAKIPPGWYSIGPENLASCPVCACLVVVYPLGELGEGGLIVWDPSRLDRWIARSLLPPGAVERQGWGLILGGHHECPPPSECRIQDADRWPEDPIVISCADLALVPEPQERVQEAPGAIPGDLRDRSDLSDPQRPYGAPGGPDREGGLHG